MIDRKRFEDEPWKGMIDRKRSVRGNMERENRQNGLGRSI